MHEEEPASKPPSEASSPEGIKQPLPPLMEAEKSAGTLNDSEVTEESPPSFSEATPVESSSKDDTQSSPKPSSWRDDSAHDTTPSPNKDSPLYDTTSELKEEVLLPVVAPPQPEPAATFQELNLPEPILKAVIEAGYETPTQIQRDAIPVILNGQDVIGASQTGTGKTAAFALPSLARIEKKGKPQIVVLEPTRELAHQVAEQFEKYGKYTECKVALLYGGVGYGEQVKQLQEGADIVVATPGRLIDHFYRGTMRFKEVSILILDEVDRMLDMGFLPAVRKIVNLCPWHGRQSLFFSATMPPAIETFATWCLDNPKKIEVARSKIAKTIRHAFYPVAGEQRDKLLVALLCEANFKSAMVFTRTRKEADAVTKLLSKEHPDQVTVMHSDIRQTDRNAALKGFKEGLYTILVATDVAARGIDISSVSHVVNYRVPDNAEDYVHRIGRTGRATKEGDACTILSAEELDHAAAIEALTNQKIARKKVENFEYIYTALLDDKPSAPRRKRPSPPKRRRR